ncbi:conserved hypothetical protein [Chlorobaculum parvum NCIB 8327]|uniref:Porin n=2 Tax=Chlorobaculum parvum TaxID=274539 RepID=B3QN24_CHLP8|nr:conserved hypothetical protein [Chlorobaculum parvum NCIB 8327]
MAIKGGAHSSVFNQFFSQHKTAQHTKALIMKKTLFFVALATAMGFNNAQAVDWDWKGDIRYRYESKIQEDQDHSRDRHRIRVRFGMNAWINEELSAGLRLATGDEDDPISRNQTLTNNFGGKNIMLDEAYINYHPMMFDGDVNLLLGKRETKSTLFVEDDLLWDGDLTLEGITLQYGKDINGKQKSGFGAIAGWYSINESKSEGDPYFVSLQGAYKGEASDLKYDLGVGYHDFVHYMPGYDLNIVEFFGSIGGDLTETVPWKLYGQYAFNTASHDDNFFIDDSERDGYLVGLKIGKAKKPGQIEGSVEYVHLESDAVASEFTDSDRNGGGTNCEGIKLNAKYQLIQNMTLGVTYFNFNDITGPDKDLTNHLLQADVVVKF